MRCVCVCVCVCVHVYILRYAHMYTLYNKDQVAWNFVHPTPEVKWRTVAIIIQVILLSPYLCIRGISRMVTMCFPPISLESSVTRHAERYKWMNQPLAVETGAFLHRGLVLGTWRGGGGAAPLLGTLRERWDFVFIRGCVKEGFGNGHLSIEAPLGNL
jgi:hypothetical protein